MTCEASVTLARGAIGTALVGAAVMAFSPSQSAPKPQEYSETIPGTVVTFEMVLVPGGTVTFGGISIDVAPFYVGRTEATWDMYDAFALDVPRAGSGADAVARPSQPYGAPDYGWGHAGFPAISVTRAAAEAYCAWLSEKTGKKYRLPTEPEWVHAAALASGADALNPRRRTAIAWHRENANGRTHAVATKAGDAIGLRDFFGNAAEWVTAADGALVLRGGSYRDAGEAMGPASRAVQDESWNVRDPQLPKSRWWLSDAPFAGFRVVSEN
jgi:formylglycine-generating enzyme required for sulfatase activity